MKKFYYEFETLKSNIRKYGLLNCEEQIDEMLEVFRNHENVGLVVLKKAQIESRFGNKDVAEELLLQLQSIRKKILDFLQQGICLNYI